MKPNTKFFLFESDSYTIYWEDPKNHESWMMYQFNVERHSNNNQPPRVLGRMLISSKVENFSPIHVPIFEGSDTVTIGSDDDLATDENDLWKWWDIEIAREVWKTLRFFGWKRIGRE